GDVAEEFALPLQAREFPLGVSEWVGWRVAATPSIVCDLHESFPFAGTLDAGDHDTGPAQRCALDDGKTRIAHPIDALRAGVVESAARVEQHVETHEQPGRVAPPLVVEHPV